MPDYPPSLIAFQRYNLFRQFNHFVSQRCRKLFMVAIFRIEYDIGFISFCKPWFNHNLCSHREFFRVYLNKVCYCLC